ncbi:MAG: winged helix-turn-helix transcriptional regulator [Treponema sp.]|nr:winged helix-turn-helix transcriptional regulator [Treponema sp.]
MNSEVATLQTIANTLEQDPLASQRVLAEKAGMSIGLMNAVLKRFVERGWIMLTNVNLRKLSYAITPAGIAELTARSQKFARRNFELANEYHETLCKYITEAKKQGKTKLYLYGQSYIKFLLVYSCQILNVTFAEKDTSEPVDNSAFCVVGELNEEEKIRELEEKGCLNLLGLMKE